MTLRLVVAVVVVTIISMVLQTPLTWMSAYMVFFVTKENRVITTLTGIGVFLGRRFLPECFSRGYLRLAHWRLPSVLCWR